MDWKTAGEIIVRTARSYRLPKSGYVKLGYACNNCCRFCTAAWKHEAGDRSTEELLLEFDKLLHNEGIARLVLSGGEPTIRLDIVRLVSYAREHGAKQISLQTNARALSDAMLVRELYEAGVTSCFVSIHGCDAAIHDSLTGRPGSFSQTCAGILNLLERGIAVTTNTVAVTTNVQQLPDIVSFLAHSFSGLQEIKLSYPNLQGGAADLLNELVLPLWQVAPFMLAAIKQGDCVGVRVTTEFLPPCLLATDCNRASEIDRPVYHLSDVKFTIPEIDHTTDLRPRFFPELCDECPLCSNCCGIHPLHRAAFGEEGAHIPPGRLVLAGAEAADVTSPDIS